MTDTDTLRLLRDAAESFAKFDAGRVREWRNRAPGFDRTVWRSMADQGWLSILVDEDAGGLALGLDAAATVARLIPPMSRRHRTRRRVESRMLCVLVRQSTKKPVKENRPNDAHQ